MKILFAVTPAISHLSPILSVVRMVQSRGDEAVVATGTHLETAVRRTGAGFLQLAPQADLDLSRVEEIFPERLTLQPGLGQIRQALERVFLDPMPAQAATLREAIASESPDLVLTDSSFMGRAALFLDAARPPVPLVSCGFTILTLDRPDGAPLGLGLPPAQDDRERARYAALAAEFDASVGAPTRAHANAKLAAMGLPRLPCSVFSSMVLLADAYLHPTVPAFEYDYGPLPANVRFVGALPPPPASSLPLPTWWGELDGDRRVVLVTQGTVANADFGELVEPTLAALVDRDDVLVVVTTGGRSVTDVRGPIPVNARLAEFLDYGALLPRVDVLVTNGGYGTVSLALRAGVPIIAAGRTEEKADVGARVAWSGAGVEIPLQRPASGDLRAALDRVLSDSVYRRRAEDIAAAMASVDTRGEILDVLDRLVERSKVSRFGEKSV